VDGYLWITSDTDYMLYKVDPADGAVVDQITPPGSGSGSLTGLTWDGEHLLCTLQAPPWRIYFIDTETGLAVDSIPTPSASNNEGLAWDGTYIWSTNYSNNVIYKLDPGTGDVLEYFQPYSPMGCTGLAFDGFNIYVSMQNTPMIYVLLPMVPQPVSYFMLSCETPQDIAWDGTYIWITEYEEPGLRSTTGPRTPIIFPLPLGQGEKRFSPNRPLIPVRRYGFGKDHRNNLAPQLVHHLRGQRNPRTSSPMRRPGYGFGGGISPPKAKGLVGLVARRQAITNPKNSTVTASKGSWAGSSHDVSDLVGVVCLHPRGEPNGDAAVR
jgi:hypothetical protein